MRKVLEGLVRFQANVFPEESQRFERLASHQDPVALFITCSDSRIVPGLITQTKPGDLFIIRNAGNIVPSYGEMVGGVSATIEYAVVALNVRDIIICGHSDCGAMKGLLYPETLERMPTVKAWLRYADRARLVVEENYDGLDQHEHLEAIIRENTLAQLDHLMTHPCVASRVKKGQLSLHAWVYEIETGEVYACDPEQGGFRPFRQVYDVESLPEPAGLAQEEPA
jgi:carbonic anhydrase